MPWFAVSMTRETRNAQKIAWWIWIRMRHPVGMLVRNSLHQITQKSGREITDENKRNSVTLLRGKIDYMIVFGTVWSAENVWVDSVCGGSAPWSANRRTWENIVYRAGRAATFHSFFLQHNKIQQPWHICKANPSPDFMLLSSRHVFYPSTCIHTSTGTQHCLISLPGMQL